MKHLVEITTGDPGGDGHQQFDNHYFKTNYPSGKLKEAYKKSVELTGIDMHQECSDYDYSRLTEECVESFAKHGLDMSKYVEDENDNYIDQDSYVSLIMKFISLSMPEDFKYQSTGLSADSLGSFGYGLYY